MLKHLVGLNENMKAQEAAFKTSCKAQMQVNTDKSIMQREICIESSYKR